MEPEDTVKYKSLLGKKKSGTNKTKPTCAHLYAEAEKFGRSREQTGTTGRVLERGGMAGGNGVPLLGSNNLQCSRASPVIVLTNVNFQTAGNVLNTGSEVRRRSRIGPLP